MRRVERLPEFRAITVMPRQADLTGLLLPGAPPALPLRRLEGEPPRLTLDLVLRIRQEVRGVEYVLVGGGRRRRSGPLQAVDGNPVTAPQGEEPPIALVPTGADFFGARGYQVLAGAPYTWEDVRSGRPVLAVDESRAAHYLPDVPPEQVPGHTVTAFGTTWSIVAVVRRPDDPLAGVSPFGPRELVYAPWGVPDPSADEPLDAIEVLPRLDADRNAVRRELELVLTEAFGPDQMALSSVQDLLPSSQRQGTLAVAGLASLALLVASLNVLNLFLTRVVRRRRFLALSTALGASRRAIFGQTLLESLLLGLAGGAAGIALASAGVRAVEGLVLRGVPQGLFAGVSVWAWDRPWQDWRRRCWPTFSLVSTRRWSPPPRIRPSPCGSEPGSTRPLRDRNRTRSLEGDGSMLAVLRRMRQRWLPSLLGVLQVALGTGAVVALLSGILPTLRATEVPAAFAARYHGVPAGPPGDSFTGYMIGRVFEAGDGDLLRREAPSVERATTVVTADATALEVDGRPYLVAALAAVEPDYFAMLALEPVAGSLFGAAEMEQGAAVAVISEPLAAQLFGDPVTALGREVHLLSPEESWALRGVPWGPRGEEGFPPPVAVRVIGVYRPPSSGTACGYRHGPAPPGAPGMGGGARGGG